MSRARLARWGLSAVAALAAAGCLSVPAAPECDDTHPCAAGLICRATLCVEADAAPALVPPPDAGIPDAGMPDGEQCNGLDDDGDQSIDEGFDLTRDANNCGACGHACGGFGMREVCRAGTCLPVGCAPGVFDANVDASDGCEAVHGDPVLYLDGGAGVRFEGHHLSAPVPATNWGRIALRAGTDVTVSGNTITNAGGPDPWFGGEVVGVFIGAEATGVVVEDNVLGPLVAGEMYVPVVGVRAEPSADDTLIVRGNRFLDFCGACMRTGSDNLLTGVDTGRSLIATNNLFARMHGQDTAAYRLRSGLANAIVSRETFVELTASQTATGVLVEAAAQPTRVDVRNSIFARVQTPLRRESPQAEDAINLDHALVWEVEAAVDGATAGANVTAADPLLDPADDYRPRPGSPAIDAGDPGTDCSAEPPGDPDGMCRLDLGHTGNTAAAQSVGGR